MKKLFKSLLILLIVQLTGQTIQAQKTGQAYIDSLLTELPNTKEDTNKVRILNSLSERACQLGNFDFALQYADSAMVLAKGVGFERGTASAFNNLGDVNFYQGDYPDALHNSFTALQIAGTINDKNEMAAAYNNIGRVYSRQKNNSQAIENYLMSIKIMEAIDNKGGMAKAYNNIGIVYTQQDNYEKALENFSIAYELMKSIGDTRAQYIIYSNIGDLHRKMGDFSLALEKYLATLKVFESLKNNQGISMCYFNIGLAYIELYQTAEGKKWLRKSLELSKKLDTKEFIKGSYQGLSKADSISGNFSSALENYKLYIVYRDSLTNEENTKKLTQLQMQFEFDKKEAALKAEQEKKDIRQRNIRNSSFAAVGGLLLFSLVVVRQRNKVKNEKKRSDGLLLNILPQEVADELKIKGSAEAKQFDEVSILFTDFVRFTQTAEKLTPQQLVRELDECFTAFDNIMERNGLEKIKTIGDAYLAVCGLPVANPNHAHNVVRAALEIQNFIEERGQKQNTFEIRIGIHSGSVVAGIVGVKKFAYDIWGDTVNIAARMEQNSEPGKINISKATCNLVKNDFNCEYRGKIEVKGKGIMEMYFVRDRNI